MFDDLIRVLKRLDGRQVSVEIPADAAPRVIGDFRLPQSLPVGRGRLGPDDRLFVATDIGGLAIVDVGVPAAPEVLSPRARKMKVTFDD